MEPEFLLFDLPFSEILKPPKNLQMELHNLHCNKEKTARLLFLLAERKVSCAKTICIKNAILRSTYACVFFLPLRTIKKTSNRSPMTDATL
jgi:hypothetical protein